MKYYVVVRLEYFDKKYPLKDINRYEFISGNGWKYFARNTGYKQSADGFVEVFKREDAARRHFENVKGIDGDNSEVFLVYTSALTRAGAGKKSLGVILYPQQGTSEILDHYNAKQLIEEVVE